ncbi:MAG TPA: diguanylate kinase, partial [Acidimicrobiia bacterium]|nr:diguanylate kinase [Acidimicrobiia bacterium]
GVAVGERIRAAVACDPVGTDGHDVHVTVSIGCASGQVEPAEFVRQATRGLRRAKLAGKNRVVAADPPADS